jgi:hypothetical protein
MQTCFVFPDLQSFFPSPLGYRTRSSFSVLVKSFHLGTLSSETVGDIEKDKDKYTKHPSKQGFIE